MSSSSHIHWKPTFKKWNRVDGVDLKNILMNADCVRLHDNETVTLNEGYELYFQGLIDAKVDGAIELWEAIKKFGEIEITVKG